MKKNVKLTIEYDGTNYSGWQKQKDVMTIQQKVEEAIKEVTGEDIEVIGCSRTDAGVHAKGFVANVITCSKIPAQNFKYVINNKLPKDIIIINSEEVPLEFHARFDSKGKRYVYTILNRKYPTAILRNYVYHYNRELDLDLMNEASKYIVGTHDFASFKTSGSSVKSNVRTIYSLDVNKKDDKIKISVAGNGFLYNMVRIIVGTLLDVGIKRITPEDVKSIINAKDRTVAGRLVPPQGLCLEEVFY